MSKDFGKYELVEKIGTGGMAEVYLARSFGAEGLEKTLVIKRILPEFSENPRFVEMFISEAKIAVELNHPNIVQIYDFGKHEDTYYLAMEYVDGVDLGHLLSASRRSDQPVSIGNAVWIAAEIAKGLQYAHTKKDRYGDPLEIVHRDVSPQNVLVSQDGTVKIVDFGIAKASSVTDARPNQVKGKFAYMSPEQASGKPVDHRSDLFSLGVMLFELLCGRQMFQASNKDELLSLVKSAVVPDIASLNAQVPEELQRILYRVLESDPDDRYESARELQRELLRVLYGFDDIHDAGTVAVQFRKLESAIDFDQTGYLATNHARTHTRTSLVRTVAGGTKGVTPVTHIGGESEAPPQIEIHSRERKEVVIVAGELVGLFDLRGAVGQSRWLSMLQEYTRIVDSLAFKNSAVVHRVNEDGFVLLFGIPVSSENDAELAVRVALDLHDAVAAMSHGPEATISLSVGIAIGDVVLEQEVDKTGRRYGWSFFGSGHELAERLSSAGMARETLLGGQVWRRIRREYNAETVDRVEHPDDDAETQVQAYLLTGPKSGEDKLEELRRSYHRFRGRELPLKMLREGYRESLIENRSQGFLVLGAQGIGKSTLVEEFLRGLDRRNVRIVRGVVGAHQHDVPLGSVATLLGEVLRLGALDDLRNVRKTLTTRITALFPEADPQEQELLLHSIGAIFNIKWPGSEFGEFTGDERRDRIFLSLRKLLGRFAAKKPLILAFDDAQNIDSMTLSCLTEFLNSASRSPSMLILTAEDAGPHIESQAWEEFVAADNLTIEELGELGPKESENLVRDHLRVHRIDDDGLVQEILRRSGGNPLFIKEVIEILRDRGMLKDAGERQKLQNSGQPAQWMPSSVEGLIRARIDTVDLDRKVVLQRVAFLWSPFTGQDVALVCPDEPWDELEELVNLGFLERLDGNEGVPIVTWDPDQKSPPERQYAFANAMIQDAAAGGLLKEEAELIHETLARHLLSMPEERRSGANSLIARHLDGAGQRDRAVEHYFSAADDALEQYGAAEALRLCSKVLERVGTDSDYYYRATRIRARAFAELGLAQECRAALDELEELAVERGEPAEQADVLLEKAQFLFARSDLKEARRVAERAAELAREADDARRVADASLIEAMVLLNEGNREEALAIATEAAEVYDGLEGVAAAEGAIRTQSLLGVVHRQEGRHLDALEAYEAALELAEKHDLRAWRRRILTNAGLALAYLGEFAEALERYEEALEQVRSLGHRTEEANLLVNIGHCHLLRGEHDKALHSIRRGIYLARRTNAVQDLADGLISLGAVHLDQEEYKKAENTLQEGLRLADSIPNVFLSIHATLMLAQVNLGAGTSAAARVAKLQAEDALERAEQAGMKWGMGFGYSLMARAQKMFGKRDRAIENSKKALELVDAGEIFSLEEILYHHTQILPDEPEFEDERRQAIMRAREVLMHRRDKIKNEELRRLFMAKPMHRQIFNVAKLMLE